MDAKTGAFTIGCFCRRFLSAVLVAVVSACASKPANLQENLPDWSVDFPRPVEFQLLVNDDLLVVGTIRHLYGIDPKTGKKLWRQRNVAVTADDLTSLGERSYLLVDDAAGGAFDDRDTNILALDHSNGQIVWESKLLQGKILQGALSEQEDVFFFTTVPKAHGDDRGFMSGVLGSKGLGSGYEQVPSLSALEVATGNILWTRSFEEKVLMRPGERRQLDDKADWTYTRPFDLGLYHPPLIAGSLVCLTYHGIECYDSKTGSPVWNHRFSVIEDDLALSYANPVVDDTTIIASGDNRLRAYNLANGKLRWKSEKFDIISELTLDGNIVYGQLGGRFFDIHKEKWKWEGKFGVVAIDRTTGKTLWTFDDADDASTNVLIWGDKIWLADKKNLIALSRINGEEQFRTEHGFEEPPVFAALNEVGQVVLVGDGEAAAFGREKGSHVWHVRHEPVRPGAWSRFSTALMNATGNVLKFGSFLLSHGVAPMPSLALPIGSVNFKIISTKRIATTSMSRSGRRLTYHSGTPETGIGNASLSGNFQYFITESKGVKKVTLAVLNLSTGKTERLIPLEADRPNLVIDEGNNEIYQSFGQQLLAMPLEGAGFRYRAVSQQSSPQHRP